MHGGGAVDRAGGEPRESAVARVLDAHGRAVGAAFQVPGGEVVTCAHVVDRALNRPLGTEDPPTDRLHLGLPLAGQRTAVEMEVRHWRPQRRHHGRPVELAALARAGPCRGRRPSCCSSGLRRVP